VANELFFATFFFELLKLFLKSIVCWLWLDETNLPLSWAFKRSSKLSNPSLARRAYKQDARLRG
jgi:hypothetical protein